MKASDYSCVPLCSDCHTQAPGAYQEVELRNKLLNRKRLNGGRDRTRTCDLLRVKQAL
jgi:hypothetical protein